MQLVVMMNFLDNEHLILWRMCKKQTYDCKYGKYERFVYVSVNQRVVAKTKIF